MTTPTQLDGVAVAGYEEGRGLPLFVTAERASLRVDSDAVVEWFRDHRAEIDRLTTTVGAVVLRDFAISETHHFGALVEEYPTMEFGYSAGVTPRAQIDGKVFEATSAPPQFRIPLHQEMSYLPQYPAQLAFFCKVPPTAGGETMLGDMRRFDRLLDPTFRAAVAEHGVLYQRNFRSPDWTTGHPVLDARHRPWTDAFGTTDRGNAEDGCTAMGLEYEWSDDGSLTTRFRGPGVVVHPETGDDVWFNQLVQQATNVENLGTELVEAYDHHYGPDRRRPFEVYYGDGTVVADADLSSTYPLLDDVTVAFPWHAGDVMFVDNVNTSHGRNTFSGPRDIQVALLGRAT